MISEQRNVSGFAPKKKSIFVLERNEIDILVRKKQLNK